MTLPQVFEQFDYWLRSPPVHELAAGYLGYKPAATKRGKTGLDRADFGVLAAMAPGGSLSLLALSDH